MDYEAGCQLYSDMCHLSGEYEESESTEHMSTSSDHAFLGHADIGSCTEWLEVSQGGLQ